MICQCQEIYSRDKNRTRPIARGKILPHAYSVHLNSRGTLCCWGHVNFSHRLNYYLPLINH